jgi:voltage-gated potassium channel
MDSHENITKTTTSLRETIRGLYHGNDPQARGFRFALLAFDIFTIVFFIVSSVFENATWILVADAVLAVLIAIDLWVRWWISYDRKSFMLQFTTWTDVIVIITLLLPAFLGNFLFLRVLRALRLLRSYRVLADLREDFVFFRRNEEVIQSTINLMVFVFVMTALVYVLQVHNNPSINNYVDALYFTVTALTTTGFGDITLQGTTGRLLSVIILLLGVALFLRLVQTIFRPSRVIFECPDCGLNRHEADAVHCKHCGRVLHITTSGDV